MVQVDIIAFGVKDQSGKDGCSELPDLCVFQFCSSRQAANSFVAPFLQAGLTARSHRAKELAWEKTRVKSIIRRWSRP